MAGRKAWALSKEQKKGLQRAFANTRIQAVSDWTIPNAADKFNNDEFLLNIEETEEEFADLMDSSIKRVSK